MTFKSDAQRKWWFANSGVKQVNTRNTDGQFIGFGKRAKGYGISQNEKAQNEALRQSYLAELRGRK